MDDHKILQFNDTVAIDSFNEETVNNFVVSTLEDENDGDFSQGDLSLREAIALSNQQQGADTIAFDDSLDGSITLTNGELIIEDALEIEGLGVDRLTIDANSQSRVFKIDDGNAETSIDVTLNGLTITGAELPLAQSDTSGGGILTRENLELNNSKISGNAAVISGGGIYSSGEKLIVNNSTIEDNSAFLPVAVSTSEGGGIATVGTTVEINDSIIANNSSSLGGGGINAIDSQLDIFHSSITDNFGLDAGGISAINSTINLETVKVTNNETGIFEGSGAINLDSDSVLNINNSVISDNFGENPENPLPPGSTAFASGIGTFGVTNISNSTISNNTGVGFGVRNSGELNIINSTFAGNDSAGIGNLDGAVTISNSTIADNIEGVTLNGNDSAATIISTIIVDRDLEETAIDDNNNLTGNFSNLLLGELQNNGGSTETLTLLEGSPAIDAGSNPNNLAFDQRGEGFDRIVGNGTDIGAYELQDNSGEIPDELIVSTLQDENDGDFSAGDLSLREAIALAESDETITFDSNLSGGSIVLSQGELSIDRSLNIDGLGANNLTIDGNNSFRIFLVDDGNPDARANVSVSGLTIKNGYSFDSSIEYLDGGGFLNRENLTVSDSALVGNRAGNGGAIFNTGNLQLKNSLVTQSDGTGPINNDGGVVSIVNSTFAKNNVPGVSAIVNNNGGELELANSTITDNSGYGAALFNSDDSTATVASTIVAGNLAELPEEVGRDDILGNYVSQGNNLIGNTNGGSGFDLPSDLVGTADNPIDPKLGELQDNGGLTQTVALQEGSPAINAGSNSNNLETDQRGAGFDRTVGKGTDIGAYEVQTIIDDDEIIGTDHKDILRGTSADDRIRGLDGDDLILGLKGNDRLYGDAGNDRLLGNGGDDVLYGGDGDDWIFGGAGVDTIEDGVGNDIVFGGADGDIFLAANSGDDLFRGGSGSDLYVYDFNTDAGSFDRDRVHDFRQWEDKIALRSVVDGYEFNSFDDLDTNGSGTLESDDERVQILGHSTVIDFSDVFGRDSGSDTITLVGASSLNSDNFIFDEAMFDTEFG
jgi:hypothetical protein